VLKNLGMGYLRDKPDKRDYDIEDDKIKEKFKLDISSIDYPDKKIIANSKFTRIKNQKDLGACTSFSGCAILEFYIKKIGKKNMNLSERFLYRVTRRILGWEDDDTGAFLRTTMQALRRFGTCEENYWRYSVKNYNDEPDSFVYGMADDFAALAYIRLDSRGVPRKQILHRIKSMINNQIPIMFGFSVYDDAINSSNATGKIPYPHKADKKVGGHAVVITGYDDTKKIKNRINRKTTTGAVQIRNSWGSDWGDSGYGWLSYEYILKKKSNDFWVLTKAEWVDTESFE